MFQSFFRNQEMFTYIRQLFVIKGNLSSRFLGFQDQGSCCFVYLLGFGMVDFGFERRTGFDKMPYDEVIYDFSGDVGMGVFFVCDFGISGVSVQSVRAIEELADVTSNCALDQKRTPRMKLSIFREIQNQIV
jgi:hypothetical protein